MEPLIGEIKLFAGNFAPRGWFTCEGQTLAISQYQALFSLLGTYYGGDGVTTFKLPDLRGAFPTQCSNVGGSHPGGSYILGQTGGAQSFTVTSINLPPHTHSIIKGPGTNLTGGITVATTVQATTGDGLTPGPTTTNNVLGTTGDVGGTGQPALYTNAIPNTALGGVNSTTVNTLNFDPTGLTLTPWGSGPVPVPTVPPFVAMQYIIAWTGVYPSRP
jgi:microcystin-dependent protein